VSLPFPRRGGLCADDAEARATLWAAAQAAATPRAGRRGRAPSGYPSGLPLASLGAKVSVMLDLAADPEAMWKRLDAK